jgi:hypothetical protein
MLLPSMYPAAPATIQPTTSPTMILIFFRNGEPNNSMIMILEKDKNPNPINSGEPQLLYKAQIQVSRSVYITHGRGRGAKIVGHSLNIPLDGEC